MADSPLDLGAGWYARPRGLTAWPLYQSLGALGRRLVDVLLERARWKASEVWILGHRIELQLGQLIDSEEELARLCGRGTSRKVVRTALQRLVEGGFLDRRPALPAGQCPYIITINGYGRLRAAADLEGPRNAPLAGQAGASGRPGKGPAGAPVEQGKTLVNTGNTGNEACAELFAGAPAPAPTSPAIFSLKCVGKGATTFDVTQQQLAEWSIAFPAIDVLAEIRKSSAWQDASPARRKTHKGMAAHLVSWLSRAQDGGRGPRTANAGPQRPHPSTNPEDFAKERAGGF